MFRLLGRICWGISLLLAFAIMMLFGILLDGVDDPDFFTVALIGTGIIGAFIKKIWFSDIYIQSRLVFFKNKLLEGKTPNKKQTASGISQTTKEKIKLPKQPSTKSIAMNTSQEKKTHKPNFLQVFFSENLIAKIGGIVLFLGVLVLVMGAYQSIGPVGKIVLGFILGGITYIAGMWLEKKGFSQESRIVMGVAILINYLVILGGRHLLGGEMCSRIEDISSGKMGVPCSYEGFLTVGVTFLLLILNTVFAVLTALLYNSRPLLIFGFIFAYLNPILLGEPSTQPYTLLGYTMIVTLGAMYMSYQKRDIILFPASFILAAIMCIAAPWSDSSGWITKLICINMLGVVALYVSTIFQKNYKYICEFLMGGAFFLIGVMGFLGISNLSELQLIVLGISSLLFMGISYKYMYKGAYLYSIGTLGAALTLFPGITSNGMGEKHIWISVIIVGLFGLMNLGAVLTRHKEFLGSYLQNIVSGLVGGALFLTYMMYMFGSQYFPGLILGLGFFTLAAVYSSLAFVLVGKIGIDSMKKDRKYENIFYTIAAIGVSLFSLSIAFIFSNSPEIISLVWLLEANVLFYLARKTSSLKVTLGALVLFVIGILRTGEIIVSMDLWGNTPVFVTLFICAASIILNLMLIMGHGVKQKLLLPIGMYVTHHALHITGIVTVMIGILMIFDPQSEWIYILYGSTVVSALGVLYRYIKSGGLTIVSNLALIGIFIMHIFALLIGLSGGFFGSYKMDLGVSSLILITSLIIPVYEYIRYKTIKSFYMLAVTAIYILIASSIYIQYIFEITFAVTMYWGILAFAFLSYGIHRDIVKYRTIGLYMLSLTVIKIFMHDIWQSEVDDGVGFLVFMATGILMIILSTMYTKRFGNNLNHEFSPKNLWSQKTAGNISQVQKDIESIDISGISGVRLEFLTEHKPVKILAVNLIRIAKLITHSYGKTNFAPGELSGAFEKISSNYTSQLTPAQYKKVKDIVAKFVQVGGKIEFIED